MTKIIINLTKWVIAFVATLFFTACNFNFSDGIKGDGNKTTEQRNVTSNFTKIEVSNGIEATIAQAPNASITVETDGNIQRLIVTRIENGVLYIEAKENYNTNDTPKVSVTLPIVEGIAASSGSMVNTPSIIKSEKLAVEAASGSEIKLSVEAGSLSLESASGSTIEARGKALSVETSSSSGSSIEAFGLIANDVIAQASSGSSTDVHAIVNLEAKASSGSSVDYKSDPKNLKKEESSGGSVSKSN